MLLRTRLRYQKGRSARLLSRCRLSGSWCAAGRLLTSGRDLGHGSTVYSDSYGHRISGILQRVLFPMGMKATKIYHGASTYLHLQVYDRSKTGCQFPFCPMSYGRPGHPSRSKCQQTRHKRLGYHEILARAGTAPSDAGAVWAR